MQNSRSAPLDKYCSHKRKGCERLLAALGDAYRIQTYNLLIRSQMLYSIELRSRALFRFAIAKLVYFSELTKFFSHFF